MARTNTSSSIVKILVLLVILGCDLIVAQQTNDANLNNHQNPAPNNGPNNNANPGNPNDQFSGYNQGIRPYSYGYNTGIQPYSYSYDSNKPNNKQQNVSI